MFPSPYLFVFSKHLYTVYIYTCILLCVSIISIIVMMMIYTYPFLLTGVLQTTRDTFDGDDERIVHRRFERVCTRMQLHHILRPRQRWIVLQFIERTVVAGFHLFDFALFLQVSALNHIQRRDVDRSHLQLILQLLMLRRTLLAVDFNL